MELHTLSHLILRQLWASAIIIPKAQREGNLSISGGVLIEVQHTDSNSVESFRESLET